VEVCDKPVLPNHRMTIREAHLWASRFFASKGILYPDRNSEWMLRKLLNWDSVAWLTRWNEELPPSVEDTFLQWVERRGKREPLQYILGEAEFYGRTFRVTPDVLIPRPETECLVEAVLDKIRSKIGIRCEEQSLRIADIGVGSGAIAVTLALELPSSEFEVCGVDLSPAALDVAADNAKNLGAKVAFFEGNGLKPFLERNLPVHILVSNPPYIPDADMEGLQAEVRDFEPHLALRGGPDGMDPYRLLLKQCRSLMAATDVAPSLIAFEVGKGQARMVAAMIAQLFGYETEVIQDLAGIERVVLGYPST
jgi:release factor glutamine methyltransferase